MAEHVEGNDKICMKNNKISVIIVAPSLKPEENVSGISSITRFIIDNNSDVRYIHFEQGRKDKEQGGLHRLKIIIEKYRRWRLVMAENQNAIIHYNLPLSKKSLLRDYWFIQYSIKCNRKVIIHIHGGEFLTAKHIPIFLKPFLIRIFSLDVPFVVLSEKEKHILLRQFGAKKVDVLPNCVDLSDAKSYAQKIRNYDIQTIRVGYIGRIEPQKGMTELLRACQKLVAKHFPFRLVLAGKEQMGNEYLSQFGQRLGNNFVYAGIVSGKRKEDFFRNIDVFVLPSYFEGLPMSLIESMSYGVVPIVTPVGSIPEVVRDGENGLFITPRDAESIIKTITQVSSNRMLLRNLSIKARDTIFEQFDTVKYLRRLNEIYKNA